MAEDAEKNQRGISIAGSRGADGIIRATRTTRITTTRYFLAASVTALIKVRP